LHLWDFLFAISWPAAAGQLIEPISKMHLTLNSCVTNLLKMLTYYRVCCAFSSAGALLLNATYYF
jgi:hypothetical protein